MLLWLSQPGAGRDAAARSAALTRALHELPDAPLRWPTHRGANGLRRRSIRGGTAIFYRIIHDRLESAAGEVVVEVLAIVGPGQRIEDRISS